MTAAVTIRTMIETPQQYTARLLSLSADTDPLTVLQTTAARLRTLIAGRSREDLGRQPEPSRWSVVQILAHLADAEIVGAWRFRSVLESDGVALQPFDQNVWADGFRYADTDPFESVQLFDVNRRATLALLTRVEPQRREHHGMHAERGRESVDHLMRLYAGHDLNHLGQVERLIGALPPLAFSPAPVAAQLDSSAIAADIRVGTIESAAPVEGSRKLAALRVNFGDHQRTIVAGILQERDSLDALEGRQALFVINLPPRKMAGVVSEGMLFDLGFADGVRPALTVPEFPVPNGTRAG
jgi:tRNA-binding protein